MPEARYIDGSGGSVDTTDRGLNYGDGLFETVAIRANTLRNFPLHLERLELGAERLRLPLPALAELTDRAQAAAAGIENGTLKLVVTRGNGPRGYAPPDVATPTIILSAAPVSGPAPATLAVATLKMRLAENEALAGIKHLCRLEQVLGRLELKTLDADEGLMLSTSGAVIGGTSRNVFAVFGRRLTTPDVELAGIAGVMRRCVIEAAGRIGIDVTVCDLSLSEFAEADELFMTNALVGIQSVATLDGRAYGQRNVA
ncbi:MAG: aminodeoxychorismate lyase, partial [Gammaproteobacteria bacterium]|nr:aminodeoxychorismate lyase [Gammaproteobacteria bacterium]